jgi:hypothetical protein
MNKTNQYINISLFFKTIYSSKKIILLFTLFSFIVGFLTYNFQNPNYSSVSIIEIGYHRAEGNTVHTIEPVIAKIEISLYQFLKNKSIIVRPHKLSAWPTLNKNYITLETYSNSKEASINTIKEAQSYLINEHNQQLENTRKKHKDIENIKKQAHLDKVLALKNKINIYIGAIENYELLLEETTKKSESDSELKGNDLLILETNLANSIIEYSLDLENLKIELNKLETDNAIFTRKAIKKRYFKTNAYSKIESKKREMIDIYFLFIFSIAGFITSLFYVLIRNSLSPSR